MSCWRSQTQHAEDAARIVAGQCTGTPNQQWNAVAVPLISGEYQLLTPDGSMAVEVAPSPTLPTVVLRKALTSGDDSQRWRLIHAGRSSYRIQSTRHALCLEAIDGIGPDIVLNGQNYISPNRQLWEIEAVPDVVQHSACTTRQAGSCSRPPEAAPHPAQAWKRRKQQKKARKAAG